MESGDLNFLDNSGPLQACNGKTLALLNTKWFYGALKYNHVIAVCWDQQHVKNKRSVQCTEAGIDGLIPPMFRRVDYLS